MNALAQMDIAVARIKELQAEIDELKASIPQIKHDAIIEAINSDELCSISSEDATHFYGQLEEYAANLLTQDKEA